MWRGTRCALVRAEGTQAARAQATPMLERYGAGRQLPGGGVVVRRATAADVAAFRAAHGQAKAGAQQCRVVA